MEEVSGEEPVAAQHAPFPVLASRWADAVGSEEEPDVGPSGHGQREPGFAPAVRRQMQMDGGGRGWAGGFPQARVSALGPVCSCLYTFVSSLLSPLPDTNKLHCHVW